MQAAEAMTLLIQMADERHRDAQQGRLLIEEKDLEREKLAVAVSTAMLNSMIPVARYRAFVEVQLRARKSHPVGSVTSEFTVSATTMDGIKSGIAGVAINDMEIRIIIFEQTASGANMVSGFEGPTKSQRFRSWYGSLHQLETMPMTVQ